MIRGKATDESRLRSARYCQACGAATTQLVLEHRAGRGKLAVCGQCRESKVQSLGDDDRVVAPFAPEERRPL